MPKFKEGFDDELGIVIDLMGGWFVRNNSSEVEVFGSIPEMPG